MNHSFDIDMAQKFGLNEAILLENIKFWIQKNRANESHFYDGCTWTYNSVVAFREIFPYMGPKAIRAALERLIEAGVLRKGNYNTKSTDHTTWYAFVDESIYLKGQIDLPKRANGLSQKGKSTIYTDITTDITKNKTNGADAPSFDPLNFLLGKGVEQRVALDWLQVRREKRAANNETAFAEVLANIAATQIPYNDALKLCCARGWASFDGAWLEKRQQARPNDKPVKFDPTAYVNRERNPAHERTIAVDSTGEPVWEVVSARAGA